MGCIKRIVCWLAFGTALACALNLLLVTRIPPPANVRPKMTSPSTTIDSELIQEKVYLKGEVHVLRESEYHKTHQKKRTGLSMIKDLYTYYSTTKAQYSSPSPMVTKLVERLKQDVTKRGYTDDPWHLAQKWASHVSLIPERARGLGDVLAAMSGAPIIAADVGYKGTQLKSTLTLKGGQRVIFKPKWYARGEVIEGEVYAGADRHTGEIAAFHLGRLLRLTMVPLAVGRKVSLRHQILPVASRRLAATFFKQRGGQTCFYGVCYYCHRDASVCDDGHYIEGTIILWLPSKLPLQHLPHPWARTYKNTKEAKWEQYDYYCEDVLQSPWYSRDSHRLLDLMDTAVFDFLIQNGDRHHYTVVAGKADSSIVLLDNGKSFGDAFVDHLDVLAPLLQCCRLRHATYEKLVLLSGGGLSQAMEELLALDPLAPILTPQQLQALDRRLHFVLAALHMCENEKGGWHHVLF